MFREIVNLCSAYVIDQGHGPSRAYTFGKPCRERLTAATPAPFLAGRSGGAFQVARQNSIFLPRQAGGQRGPAVSLRDQFFSFKQSPVLQSSTRSVLRKRGPTGTLVFLRAFDIQRVVPSLVPKKQMGTTSSGNCDLSQIGEIIQNRKENPSMWSEIQYRMDLVGLVCAVRTVLESGSGAISPVRESGSVV